MIQTIYFFVIIFLSLLLQSYFDLLSIAGVKPDLLLLATIYFSFKEGFFRGLWIGFGAGILQDVVASVSMGFHALPKALMGYLVGKYGNSVRGDSLFSLGILIFFLSLLKGLFAIILAFIFLEARFEMLYKVILPESIYNAILGPMLFTIYDKLFDVNIAGGEGV